MERAQRLVEQQADPSSALLKLLAHDLREPFGPLGLALSMLAESVPAADAALVRMAEANCARVVRIIDAVLLAMRPNRTLELEHADLGEIAQAAAETARALGTVCFVETTRCDVDVARTVVRDLIVGLLESVPQGKAAVLSVHPDGPRAVLELYSDGVDWRGGLAGGAPHDRHSAFVLGAAAVLAAHGGGMEVGDGTVTGWIPLRS